MTLPRGPIPGSIHNARHVEYGNFRDTTIKEVVRSKCWMKAVGLSAVALALPTGILRAQSTTPGAPAPSIAATQPVDLTASAIADLTDPKQPQEVRDEAARNLIATQNTAIVRPILLTTLSGDPAGQLAVARGLASVAWPDNVFVDPLIALAGGHDTQQAAAAAGALAQFKSNPRVQGALIDLSTRATVPPDIRVPMIRALGSMPQKNVADVLAELLKDPDTNIQQASCEALADMTGERTWEHDVRQWQKWWSDNSRLSDTDFAAELQIGRTKAYGSEVVQREAMDDANIRILQEIYEQAATKQEQADILYRFLHASDPAVRELGAREVELSGRTPSGVPPGAMLEVRRLVNDVSPDVRRQAARALVFDPDSAPIMVAQLRTETDDRVRVALIHSLAHLPAPSADALELMISLVKPDASPDVLIECADGITAGADVVRSDPHLHEEALANLISVLDRTGQPGTDALEEAIVRALGSLHDTSLERRFIEELVVAKPLVVRQAALTALGVLDDKKVADTIAEHLDDGDAKIRVAAVRAMTSLPMEIYRKKLVERLADPDEDVKAAAWEVLQTWIPVLSNEELVGLAQDLKPLYPARQLDVLLALHDRLDHDSKNAPTAAERDDATKNLATYNQDIGDVVELLATSDQATDPTKAIAEHASASKYYKDSLDYWQNKDVDPNPNILDSLCGNVEESLLSAHKWDDATHFASDVIRKFSTSPGTKSIVETVSEKIIVAAKNLDKPTDPGAYDDAVALFGAIMKMDPPLTGNIKAQLLQIQNDIENNHSATTRGGN
jgi:HEAT repeat protein